MIHMKDIPGTKHIYRKRYDFSIDRRENDKNVHYISVKSLIEALMIRDLLVANNWDRMVIPKHETHTNEKYIYPVKGGYFIGRNVNGNDEYHGFFKTLEEAIHERDLLIKYNWDYDLLVEHDETFENGVQWLNGRKSTQNQIYTPPKGRIDYDMELIYSE